MSHYWNNNPEAYEEIVQRGIARLLIENGDPREVEDIVDEWVENPLSRKVEQVLSRKANQYIINEEQDYWGNFAQ